MRIIDYLIEVCHEGETLAYGDIEVKKCKNTIQIKDHGSWMILGSDTEFIGKINPMRK